MQEDMTLMGSQGECLGAGGGRETIAEKACRESRVHPWHPGHWNSHRLKHRWSPCLSSEGVQSGEEGVLTVKCPSFEVTVFPTQCPGRIDKVGYRPVSEFRDFRLHQGTRCDHKEAVAHNFQSPSHGPWFSAGVGGLCASCPLCLEHPPSPSWPS